MSYSNCGSCNKEDCLKSEDINEGQFKFQVKECSNCGFSSVVQYNPLLDNSTDVLVSLVNA